MNQLKKLVKNNILLYKMAIFFLSFFRKVRIKYLYVSTLKSDFRKNLGYELNLDNPKTFSEKLQWLKVNYRDPIMVTCADKVSVREYIANKVGEEYLIPIYGVWNSADEIDFSKLPKRFVLKPSHLSGHVTICKDKDEMDWYNEKKKIRGWLKENYYYQNGEWVYKEIPPKVLCEKLLADDIIDYKFYCFDGKVQYFMVSYGEAEHCNRNHKFDMELNSIDFLFKKNNSLKKDEVKIPKNFKLMTEIVKKLCVGFPHVRVDLYNVNGKIYCGELTFFSNAGFVNVISRDFEREIGEWIDLRKYKKARY